jgi:hypothetical protein
MVIGDAPRRSFSLKGRTFMTLRCRGNFARLQKYVSAVDPEGHWRGLEYGGKQYRTDDGVVVNWWKASGNILFQGRCSAPLKFKQTFIAVASTKGRLEDEDGKSLRDLGRENETLRTLIADVLLENAGLKGDLLTFLSFDHRLKRKQMRRFISTLTNLNRGEFNSPGIVII